MKDFTKVQNVYVVEPISRTMFLALGYHSRVVRYLRLEGYEDDYIGVIYRGTEQQCHDWLRTSLHQHKLPR